MRRDKMPTFVLAGAIVVGALLFSGAPSAAIVLPLILLACPLMMIFMMRGMNHGGGQSGHGDGHGADCHGGHSGDQGTAEHTGHRDEPTARPVDKDSLR